MTAFWAKLWVDILGDPKLMRAARKGAPGIELLPWFIAWAKRADDDGRLTVNGEAAESADYVEQIPNMTQKRIKEALASLVKLGVLTSDAGVLRFTKWDRRQSAKPSDSPEKVRGRVAKHRARTREETVATSSVTPDVTRDVTPPVTLSVSRQTETETETAEEDDRQQPEDVVVWRAGHQSVEDRAHSDAAHDYATKLTVAANRAITARWGEQTRPLMAGQAYELVSTLMELGIAIVDASESIREQCSKSAKAFPPKAINWFKQGILDAADLKQTLAADASMPREDPNDPFGLRKWAREEAAKEAAIA
jgi:hypothetical protein